jgi:UDP-glucose 4-epimerase
MVTNHYPARVSKIAITGGAGFVGSNLLRTLISRNYEVVVVDNLSTGLKSNLHGIECDFHEVSIEDFSKLSKALDDCQYIFHLAARGSVPRSVKNPRATFDTNVFGTINVLECAKRNGAVVAFSSSSSVYGANVELPKNEKMWLAPLTPYAASKLAGESLVQSYSSSYGLKAMTYRFFNIFGPWQRPDHDYAAVIPKWIWKLMRQEKIEIFGDGTQSRDFTYIDSVVSILIDGMERELNHPEPINLAFGSKISLNETVQILKARFPKLEVDYLPERVGDVKNSQNDPYKLFSLFRNVELISFESALDKTIEWYNENGKRIADGPQVSD